MSSPSIFRNTCRNRGGCICAIANGEATQAKTTMSYWWPARTVPRSAAPIGLIVTLIPRLARSLCRIWHSLCRIWLPVV